MARCVSWSISLMLLVVALHLCTGNSPPALTCYPDFNFTLTWDDRISKPYFSTLWAFNDGVTSTSMMFQDNTGFVVTYSPFIGRINPVSGKYTAMEVRLYANETGNITASVIYSSGSPDVFYTYVSIVAVSDITKDANITTSARSQRSRDIIKDRRFITGTDNSVSSIIKHTSDLCALPSQTFYKDDMMIKECPNSFECQLKEDSDSIVYITIVTGGDLSLRIPADGSFIIDVPNECYKRLACWLPVLLCMTLVAVGVAVGIIIWCQKKQPRKDINKDQVQGTSRDQGHIRRISGDQTEQTI